MRSSLLGKISKKNVLLPQPKFQISSMKIRFEPFRFWIMDKLDRTAFQVFGVFRPTNINLLMPRTANSMNSEFKTFKHGERPRTPFNNTSSFILCNRTIPGQTVTCNDITLGTWNN